MESQSSFGRSRHPKVPYETNSNWLSVQIIQLTHILNVAEVAWFRIWGGHFKSAELLPPLLLACPTLCHEAQHETTPHCSETLPSVWRSPPPFFPHAISFTESLRPWKPCRLYYDQLCRQLLCAWNCDETFEWVSWLHPNFAIIFDLNP